MLPVKNLVSIFYNSKVLMSHQAHAQQGKNLELGLQTPCLFSCIDFKVKIYKLLTGGGLILIIPCASATLLIFSR